MLYMAMVKLLMFGFVSQFDESETKFMSLFMLGTASPGFVVMIIQSAILTAMDYSDVIKTSYVYFSICAVILAICLALFLNVLKYPIIREKLFPTKNESKMAKKRRMSIHTAFKKALIKKYGFDYNETFGAVNGSLITM